MWSDQYEIGIITAAASAINLPPPRSDLSNSKLPLRLRDRDKPAPERRVRVPRV